MGTAGIRKWSIPTTIPATPINFLFCATAPSILLIASDDTSDFVRKNSSSKTPPSTMPVTAGRKSPTTGMSPMVGVRILKSPMMSERIPNENLNPPSSSTSFIRLKKLASPLFPSILNSDPMNRFTNTESA